MEYECVRGLMNILPDIMRNRFNEEIGKQTTSEEIQPLALVSVDQVREKKFYIPAYQRGYRWRSEEIKVLIDDLLRFMKEEWDKAKEYRCPFYCMQAVVVKNREPEHDLEVIDGQQRLTTVLILLQALYTVKHKMLMMMACKLNDDSVVDWLENNLYSIQYETRKSSTEWLFEITKAYINDTIYRNQEHLKELKDQNSDYYHFVEAFDCAISTFTEWTDSQRNNFLEMLKQQICFIWYNISLADTSDTNVDIFDRINATKIQLNNAELIKGLFLQSEHFASNSHLREQMAIDWDRIEKRLQNPSFWGFIYSTRHPYRYQTRIEYLFDLIKNKTKEKSDYYTYTFNEYNKNYPNELENRLEYINKCWREVQDIMFTLEEWYSDRICYHYIGYLLEYGKDSENNDISILYLKSVLTNIPKSERIAKLKKLIKYSLNEVKPNRLFHSQSGNYVTQVLFLLNIQSEQNRKSDTARFSFSNYKEIKESVGWNEEHVASNTDYTPKYEDREGLAYAILEYFTGVKKNVTDTNDDYKKEVQEKYPSDNETKELCERVLAFLDINNTDEDMKKMHSTYFAVIEYFDQKNEDSFKDDIKVGNSIKREKDFIWNFALLNGTTNKSYGNDIYPLKRKRIMSDEFSIYTPICTRAMFEKAYSHKLSNMMVWGRTDAKDYWDYICNCLKDFLPEDFQLPFKY